MANPYQIRPGKQSADAGVINSVSAQQAGWQFLNMEARRLQKGCQWSHDTQDHEFVMVVLGGRCAVQSNRGCWDEVGFRANVFAGMPYALYLPPDSQLKMQALSDQCEIACAWVKSAQMHPARLIRPEDSVIEIRGGGNATRQINSIIAPGFDCHKLVVVEVYTPGGNWSSYPPHKHDQHIESQGVLKEADLEEIYFYKFERQEGFAFQRIYTDCRSIDCAVVAQDNDIVLIPQGYHPVCAAYGYNCYYLNFLAGSAQSLAATDDPELAWTKSTWKTKDPRVPLVSHVMEEAVPR